MQGAADIGGAISERQSSAAKMLGILLAVGELGLKDGGKVRLADLVALTGHPRPTVHRLLNDLKAAGFVSQEMSGPYRLGPKILLLAAQCLGGLDIRRLANPVMQALSERFGHTVHLGIRDGVEVVYIDKVEPPRGIRVGSTIGQRRDLAVTALGKALLASSSPSLVAEVGKTGWTRRTGNTLRSLDELERQLADIRSNGYAIDDEESDLGLRCTAAAILDRLGMPVAAISVTTLSSQVDRVELARLGTAIAEAARDITAMLSGAGTGSTPGRAPPSDLAAKGE